MNSLGNNTSLNLVMEYSLPYIPVYINTHFSRGKTSAKYVTSHKTSKEQCCFSHAVHLPNIILFANKGCLDSIFQGR